MSRRRSLLHSGVEVILILIILHVLVASWLCVCGTVLYLVLVAVHCVALAMLCVCGTILYLVLVAVHVVALACELAPFQCVLVIVLLVRRLLAIRFGLLPVLLADVLMALCILDVSVPYCL